MHGRDAVPVRARVEAGPAQHARRHFCFQGGAAVGRAREGLGGPQSGAQRPEAAHVVRAVPEVAWLRLWLYRE